MTKELRVLVACELAVARICRCGGCDCCAVAKYISTQRNNEEA